MKMGIEQTTIAIIFKQRQHRQFHSIREGGTSEYIYIYWAEQAGKWRVEGKNKHLGHFVIEINAARAYDRAAIGYYGESAILNFPRSDYP